MNEIDKIFKNKLQNRKFDFKDSYWQQAEQMIDARQSGSDWKKGFWLFGLLLLIGLAAVVFWPNEPQIPGRTTTSTLEFGTQSSVSNHSVPSKPETEQNHLERTAEAGNSDQNSNSNSSHLIQNQQLRKTQTATSGKPAKTATSISGVNGNHSLSPGFEKKNKQNNEIGNDQSIQRAISDKVSMTDLADKDGTITTLKNENSTSPEIEMKSNQNREYVPQQGENQQEGKSEIEADHPSFTSFKPLEPIFIKAEDPVFADFSLTKISLSKKRKFSLGITIAGTSNTEEVTGKYFSGLKGGLLLQYHFTKTVSVNLEMLYAFQNNLNLEIASTTQSQFSFGLENSIYKQNTKSLHAIELPIYLQWRFGRNTIEGGMAFNYLTGVFGTTTKYRKLSPWEPGITPYKIESEKKSWLSDDPFNRLNYSVLLGYRYMMDSRFSVGFRTAYRLNELTNNQIAPDQVFADPTKLQLQVSATWLLK